MAMTSDETHIQIFAKCNCPLSHAKRVTRDNRKNAEYRVVAAISKLRTDTNCPSGKSWPNHVENEQHIGSEKTYGPKNIGKLSIMMQRTANENTACLRRIYHLKGRPKRDQANLTSPNLMKRWVGTVQVKKKYYSLLQKPYPIYDQNGKNQLKSIPYL